MTHFLTYVVEPGFLGSASERTAALVGSVVALASGTVGVFTVIRGQSFAGHALADVGTTGGSGAFLIGVNPLWGFVATGMIGAGAMEAFGLRRPRGRDVATGIVLGAALGIAALFLYWSTTIRSTTGATMKILFGSMWTIYLDSGGTIAAIVILSIVILTVLVVLYRPLMMCSVSSDIAGARGVPVRMVGAAYLMVMAGAVSLSAVTIGAILSTALLIGPAATALRLTRRPGTAVLVSGAIGVTATLLGILLAHDSYYWPPLRHGWPVSFFIVTLVFAFYLIAGTASTVGNKPRRASRVTES